MNAILSVVNHWWSNQDAGYIGAAAGVLGAILGCTGGLCSWRLRTPAQFRAMRLFFLAVIAIGLVSLAAGIAALAVRQPYHVFYPLLLAGLLFSIIPTSLLFAFKNCQRRIENLRLESESLRRG